MTILNEELNELITELRYIEARIAELTGDTVDTIIDSEGKPFMLSHAQHELRERAEVHRQYAELQTAIINAIPAHITLLDGEGKLIEVNEAWRDFAKKNNNPDGLFGVGQNYLKTCEAVTGEDESHALEAASGIRRVLIGEQSSFTMEYPCHSPVKQRWFRLMVAPLSANDRHGAVIMHLDITERKLADIEMQRAWLVFKSSNDGVLITDPDLSVLDVNLAFTTITGYPKETVIGQKIKLINYALQPDGFKEIVENSLKTDSFWRGEVHNRRKSGEKYIENLSISHVHDAEGQLINYIAIFSDITQSKTHEQELYHVAYHDSLTGLPNRRLMTDRLQQAMLKNHRNKNFLAVCFIDIDNFKPINDQFGHTVGDQVLVEISHRLKQVLREYDTVSRIGGDEFILLLSDLKHIDELDTLLERLMRSLEKIMVNNKNRIKITASIGVVLFPDDNVDADTLLRHADQAMYIAKEKGRNQYHIYDSKLAREMEKRSSFLEEIKNGIDAKDFVLFYQPKVDFVNRTVIGFEALVRWQHPTRGLLSPATFLPAITGSDIEILFGDYVMRCAIEQLNNWKSQGEHLKVSVNVSANELRQIDLIDKINYQLQCFPEIDASQLDLEVLETAAVDDMPQVISTLTQCRTLGIGVSLDDFGTGYSSLTIFRQLPVDILKIDQSFVRNMLNDADDESIVASIIGMAKVFDCKVIAEGVETQAHASRLIEIGCEYGQGYGIAKPMPAMNVLDWLEQSKPTFSWLR